MSDTHRIPQKLMDELVKQLEHRDKDIVIQGTGYIKLGNNDFYLTDETLTDIESNTKPEKCYHDWVTQTMFRFDTTYCKKCGIEKGKE